MSKTARRADPEAVTARAQQLAADARTRYWLVVSLADGLALLRGEVPPDVRVQVAGLVKREPYESAAGYLARLEGEL
jgi:hypothetical protein